MDSNRPAVHRFFRERHVRLRERWLDSVFAFLRHKHYGQVSSTVLCNLIYEQWLYSDLSASSEPASPKMTNLDSMSILEDPIVLQVKHVLDISASFYSQVKSLTDEFVDNSGFEALDEFEQKEIIKEAKVQRTLHLTLTNGSEDFEAFEWKPVAQLSFLTKPGAKVLLLPPVKCRRGQFMLEPLILQVLGGDLDEAMESFNPVTVMSEKLGIVPRGPRITISNQRPALVPIQEASPTRVRPFEASGAENEEQNQFNTALNRSMIMEGGLLDDDDFEAASEEPISEENSEEQDILNQVIIEESDSDDGESFTRRGRLRRSQLDYVTSTSPISDSPPRPLPSANRSATTTANTSTRSERLITSFSRTPGSSRGAEKRKSALRQENDFRFDVADFDGLDEPSTSTSLLKNSLLDMALGEDDADLRPSGSKTRPSMTTFAAPVVAKSGTSTSTSSKPTPIIDPRRRRTINDIRQFVKSVSTPSTSQPPKSTSSSTSTRSPLKKKVKMEVIDISSDDEDVKPDVSKLRQQAEKTKEEERIKKINEEKEKAKEREDQPHKNTPCVPVIEEVPQLVALFKSLSVTTIAEAMNRTRFGVASKRFRILGTIGKVVEPLRIVDGCWTMKVVLADTSRTVECYVDDPTLTRMIGWTPQEGERAKNSSDEFRRKEGARRLAGVEEQFRRLDLLMDVEFFPPRISDPVIRYLDTLYESLLNIPT